MNKRMVGLLALGGLQGVIGWWMVRSGIEHKKPDYQSRQRVSTYRLLVHNCMAVSLYSVVLYHALLILNPRVRVLSQLSTITSFIKTRKYLVAATHCFALNLVSGVAVAGIDAGRVFNTWPLMNG